MPATSIHAESTPARPPGRFLKVWLPVILFGLLWVDLVRQLSYQWEASEQYAYGWFVPFLTLALFWRRWVNRPAPQSSPPGLVVHGLVVLLALCWLPVRLVHEINPDWPLCNWLLTLLVVGFSLYAIFLAGGWRWVRYFAFPICFILIAVRWPYRIEHGLTQGLMRVVASLTVEIIGWFNIPAFQRGNLIEISTGVVGIDEACSGIRSFQSTLMAALFLGELYRLKWARRVLLLVGGVALAFCFNVVRTLILTWQASTSGLVALEKWHDPAGMMIFLLSFACLWGLAIWLRKKSDHVSRITYHASPVANPQPSLPRHYLMALGCWAIICFVATEVWYRSHEPRQAGMFHWSVSYPTNSPAFKPIELAERTHSLIGHDSGGGASWGDANGVQWTAYFFRWNPTSVESLLRARIHRPERCLPASGLRQVADGGLENFAAGGLQLSFRRSTYEAEGRTLYVFFCQWEDGSEQQGGVWGSKLADRIRSVLVGRRKLGQQTMEVILTGPPTLDEATVALRQALPGLIRVEHPLVKAAAD